MIYFVPCLSPELLKAIATPVIGTEANSRGVRKLAANSLAERGSVTAENLITLVETTPTASGTFSDTHPESTRPLIPALRLVLTRNHSTCTFRTGQSLGQVVAASGQREKRRRRPSPLLDGFDKLKGPVWGCSRIACFPPAVRRANREVRRRRPQLWIQESHPSRINCRNDMSERKSTRKTNFFWLLCGSQWRECRGAHGSFCTTKCFPK